MGARRRGGGGGIRKKSKRNDPNRQRLEKYVRKAAEREDRIERKIAGYRARFAGVPQQPTPSSNVPIPDVNLASEDGSDEQMKSSENPRQVVGQLMKLISTSSKKERKTLKRPRIVPQSNKPSSVAPEPLTEEVADATAAARELAHFGLDSATVQAKEVPSSSPTVADVPEVGRVSTTYESGIPDDLPTDIQALALQPTLDRQWRVVPDCAALDPLNGVILSGLRDFRDILLTRRLPPATETRVRRLVVAHIVAHVLRTRARAKRHAGDEDGPQDQGYARPRVLILCPMRNLVHDIVTDIAQLCASETAKNEMKSVAHRARFEREFGPEEDDETFEAKKYDGEEHAAHAATEPYQRGRQEKPVDFRYTFRGNNDDDFKIGLQFYRKNIKLYSDFYESDIIIASPLGLRRCMAAKASGFKGPQEKKEEKQDNEWKTGLSAEKNRTKPKQDDDDDYGFLSSIEICLVDSAHVFEMQNWDTLRATMKCINNIPAATRDTDFSRVREWALDGLMRRFRQTIVFTAYQSPQLMAMMREECSNHAGRLTIAESTDVVTAQEQVVTSVQQTFLRVPGVVTPADVPEKRIEYFKKDSLPAIRGTEASVLIFVPDYFDFVRVRNHLVSLQKEEPGFDFVSICEYSRAKDVARARARFANGQVKLMVCSERLHFYWRHWYKGVEGVLWYGLPANSHFYAEILNMLREKEEKGGRAVSSVALFDRFDAFKIERVVGPKRCRRMLARNAKDTFLFIS